MFTLLFAVGLKTEEGRNEGRAADRETTKTIWWPDYILIEPTHTAIDRCALTELLVSCERSFPIKKFSFFKIVLCYFISDLKQYFIFLTNKWFCFSDTFIDRIIS